MKKRSLSQKKWLSSILVAGTILIGLLSGEIIDYSEQGAFAEVKEPTGLKTIDEATKIKKSVFEIKDKTTNKEKREAATQNYVGPTKDAASTTWDMSKDYASQSSTTYVSDPNSSAVMYFGNQTLPFQPNELTNDKPYSYHENASSWISQHQDGPNQINNNPSTSYGIIINSAVPSDRQYGRTSETTNNTIEGGLSSGSITDYHLYKNTTGTGFKATMYDTTYDLSYTFEELYDGASGIYRYFSITNNATTDQTVGATEGVDTYVDTDNVGVQSLGPNAGFKMNGGKHTLNVKLRDPKTNAPLGGWTNYTAGNYGYKNGTSILDPDNVDSYFKGGILGTGMEDSKFNDNIAVTNIDNPDLMPETDSGFVMKANPKKLAQGETLTSGSYLIYRDATPPVATVKTPLVNAYVNQRNLFKITGTVKDIDGSTGEIEIKYPDGTTSAISDNTYDTKTNNTTIDYTASINVSKLKLGENKLTITAIDGDFNRQVTPVEVTVNLFKLGATPIVQNIKVGGTIPTDESKLIKDLTIMDKPTLNKHTLKIDSSNPSGKPLDNTKAGFYFQDMLLTDTDATPNEVAKVAIPVNVSDSNTVVGDKSAVYAKSFSTTVTNLVTLTGDDLNKHILKESGAKGWMLDGGAESKVTVKSTTLKATSSDGVYKATISNAEGKEVSINITVTGGLKIVSAPDSITYGATSGVMLPYSTENFNLQRQDNKAAKVSISNMGKQSWNLSAKVSKPLTNGSNTLKGVLKYIDTSNVVTDLDNGSVSVGSGKAATTQDVTWDAKQGIIANLNGNNTSLKTGKYTGEITWTLTDAP
ncbi:hypothetical protein [Dellaglioa algida]|uniref:hypothetical protein n=1 Tax=Dellaglioa algida TaxID=105612 RepID=UPI0024C4D95B|nr:hypothetical protein [Dellaglioa algida]MDK1725971.1 hypothetical protein [Dellaglioa algida]